MEFIIQPYVYINTNGNLVLFYNTITGVLFESESKDFINFFHKSKSISNRIISIPDDNESCNYILDSLLSDFMIIRKKNRYTSAMWKPILNIQEQPEKIKNQLKEFDGVGVLKYLSELSLFINGYSNNRHLSDTYNNQILFPVWNNQHTLLTVDSIKKIINKTAPYISQLNIVAGSLLEHPKYKSLLSFLNKFTFDITIYCYFKEICFLQKNRFSTIILIDNKITTKELNEVIAYDNNFHLRFIVSKKHDYDYFEKLIYKYKIKNYSFVPILEDDLSFFETHVRFSKKDIFDDMLNFNDIYIRQTLNENKFGKLYIYPNGSIKTSLSGVCVGNISNTTIDKIIYDEINEQKDWFLTRNKFNICEKCIYNSFCPSISDYEIIMNKPLCNSDLQPLTRA